MSKEGYAKALMSECGPLLAHKRPIIHGPRLTVPTAPGIGVKFNREAAKQYPAQMTEPPHLRRLDGAYTNN